MEELGTSVGRKIKELRKAANLTQEQLAQGIGVQRSVISKYESGTIEPSLAQIKKIADFFNVPWYELLGAADEWAGKDIVLQQNPGKCIAEDDGTTELIPSWVAEKMIAAVRQFAPVAPLDAIFRRLNKKGQDVALEKLKELARIPEYTRFDDETPPQSGEGQEGDGG